MQGAQNDVAFAKKKKRQIPRSKEGFGKSANRDGSIDRFRRFRCDSPSEIFLAQKEEGGKTRRTMPEKEIAGWIFLAPR